MNLLSVLRYKVKCTCKNYFRQVTLRKLKEEILQYYLKFPPRDNTIASAVSYLHKHHICTFPAPFFDKYDENQIAVFKDNSNGLLYVLQEGKKLYFKRSYNIITVRKCFCGLITEQDEHSPHRYTNKQFNIGKGDVLFDIGSAEGNIALSHIEDLKAVVLFERDKEWLEALEATFAPWRDKVTIVGKFVSNTNDESHISIDSFLKTYQYKPTFIKIDVEGAENLVLDGMKNLMASTIIKIALCTYHQPDDYERFYDEFLHRGFELTSSEGVMLYLNDIAHMRPPYFRKGLLRIITSSNG